MISNPLGIIPEPLSTNLASDESVFAFDKNDLPSLVIKEGAEEYIIDDDKSLFVGLLKEYTCSTGND